MDVTVPVDPASASMLTRGLRFEAESKLTPAELKAQEDRRAEANARELIREEPWS